MTKYIDINDYQAFRSFTTSFKPLFSEEISKGFGSVVFMCIGTDRSTGDSLGPLIGYKLSNLRHSNVYVYGTLDNPVHAKNLSEIINNVYAHHPNPLVIAIDACLGIIEHVGYINISKGSIKPGAGVNKDLPEVGNISITGIVNISGFMDFLILQNTRLNLVMKMADLISLGIKYTLNQLAYNNELFSHNFSTSNEKQFVLE